ncbi:type II toxin-antitoxin system RelE/ParE family toxin [Longimicrobium sp.]|uniref:type II toxin-antitoxin system RelE/ParE family toxin n=1 Tax=Longimicrobium sp. TaxID=2029185 RepID=UPI003B3B8D7F
MTVIWSPRAIVELESEASWIAVDRPHAAWTFIEKMLDASARLGEYPYSGKQVRGHSDLPLRELVVAPYRMIYLPQPRKVSIVTLKHSREELTEDDLVLESSEESEW